MSEASALPTAVRDELHALVFGKAPEASDVERWHGQGFTFSSQARLQWGLTQRYGGPCGVLAAVQAHVVHDLVFVRGHGASLFEVTAKDATKALISSLTRILCRAAGDKRDFSLLCGALPDDVRLVRVRGPKELVKAVAAHLSDTFRGAHGVLLFTYSVLLTRGLERCRADMDDASVPLVARFGHCGQELVNLMLTGVASTNVFDGDKVLGDDPSDPTAFSLKGVPERGDVGFLTLLEHMRYCSVGGYYKNPAFPVFVVGSSSHYTVLFAIDERVGRVSDVQARQDQLRTRFNLFDPHENGFVPTSELASLVAGIDELADTPLGELQKAADPDDMGIVTWQAFLKAVADAKARPPPKACPRCTFNNPASAASCTMCGGALPPQPQQQPQQQQQQNEDGDAAALRSFDMFHFNGLETAEGKAMATCCRVRVELLDDPVPLQGDVQTRGLREVIATKWPNAIVEFDAQPEPKIS